MTEEEIRKRKEAANQYRNKTTTTAQTSTVSTAAATVSSRDVAARKKAANIARTGGDYSTDRTATMSTAENMRRHGYTNDFNERRKEIAGARSRAYMSLSDDDRANLQLSSQLGAYKRAREAYENAKKTDYHESFESTHHAKNLMENLEKELRSQYESIYGVNAGFDNWLGSAALMGADQFATGAANTAAMAANLPTSAWNQFSRYLKYGTDESAWVERYVNENEQARQAAINQMRLNATKEQDEFVKAANAALMGNTVENPMVEQMQGWLTMYKQLSAKASKLYASFDNDEADYYRHEAEKYRQKISDAFANYLQGTNEYNDLPEDIGVFDKWAEHMNDISARNQETYQKQLEYQKLTSAGNGKGWEIAGQAVTSIVQALPYAGLAMMTGGMSLGGEIGAQLAPRTISTIDKVANILSSYAKDPQYWLSFAQEAGNTYKEALDAGAGEDAATLTAVLVGLINGAIEIGLPGGNGGIQDLPENLLKQDNVPAIQKWIESMLSEGKEEILQGVISNLAEKVSYNHDKKWFGSGGVIDPENMVKEGGMGSFVGGILGGGQVMGVDVINGLAQNRIDQANANLGKRYAENADTIVQNALSMSPATESYRLASEIKNKVDNGGTRTDADVGALYRAMMRDTGYYDMARSDTITGAKNRLDELGETGDSQEIAQIIAKAAQGYNLTKAEQNTLKKSDYGLRVYNEYLNAFDKNFSAEWSEKAKLQSAERAAQNAPELTQEERAASVETIKAMQNANEAAINRMAQEYGKEGNVFKEAVTTVDPFDVHEFNTAYFTAFTLGKAGLSMENAENALRMDKNPNKYVLSDSQFKLAYESGVRAMPKTPASIMFNQNAHATVRAVGVTAEQLRAKFNDKQNTAIDVLDQVAQVTGINIVLFEGKPNEKGQYKSFQGKYTGDTIYLDINAGIFENADVNDLANFAVMRTASHEYTHYIQRNAPAEYAELKNAVFKNLSTYAVDGEYHSADEWIGAKIAAIKEATGETLSYEAAADECVADACEMMLRDSTAFETLAKESPKAAKGLLAWLKNLIKRIKAAFGDTIEYNAEARAMLSDLENIQALWDKALVQAVRNTQNAEAIQDISSTEVKNSLANDAKYMENALKQNAKEKRVSDKDMEKARKDRQAIYEIFTDPEVQESLGLPPDIIGNTFIPNGSYDGTEENSTVCPRSLAADSLMDAIAEAYGRPLTVADTIAISQEYWKYTDRPECLYCYVAMDRKAYREFMGSYLEQRDSVIKDIDSGMSEDDAYLKFLDGRSDTAPMKKRFDMWVKNHRKGVKVIQPADLASENNMRKAIERNGALKDQINDARKYAQSASWAKKRISYLAYNNHILRWKDSRINNLNKHYGLRMYSFSDFSPAFILENMQMVTDAAVRGLKMLAYTKEIDFVDIFAKTGMNINISVFGYEKDGKIYQDAMQGADWELAKDRRAKNKNVGITFVATNDTQVEWALAQDWIDVVIPFHLVRTGAKVATYFNWKNFSGMQADVKNKAWKKGDASSIYPSEHHNNKKAYLAALKENNLTPRFAKWLGNPNYMKLVNETRRSADKTPAVQPIFNLKAAEKSIETMKKQGGYYVPIGGSEEEMRDIAADIAAVLPEKSAEVTRKIAENGDIRHSDRVQPVRFDYDQEYEDAYFDGDDDAMQEIIDKVAYQAGYKYKAYHHTENAFTVFDRNRARRGMDIQGFFFSADPDAEREYGTVRYDVYLKMDNPFIVDSNETFNAIPIKFGTTDYGVKAREWLQSQGYDSVIRKAEYFGAEADEYIVFDPEQIKSAEPVTYSDDEYGEGDYIPPSERFNVGNEDIRYSDRTQPVQFQNRVKMGEAAEGDVKKTSNPYYAKRDLRIEMLNLFSIPAGVREELGAIIDQYADKVLAAGTLDQYDYDELIDTLYQKGVMTEPTSQEAREARRLLAKRKVYVPGRVKSEFVDTDYNLLKQRAFAAGIYFTNNSSDPTPDEWNVSLAAELPGFFNESETDDRAILEQMVELAEQGKEKKIPLPEYTSMLAKQGVISEEQFNDELERRVQQAVTKFAEKAQIEITMRGRNEKLMDKQRLLLENYKRARDTTAVRNKIRNLMDRWDAKLIANTPAKNIPAPFKAAMAELSEALDTSASAPLTEKLKDKLAKLKAVYDSISSDEDFKTVYADPVVKGMVDTIVNDIVAGKSVRYMSLEQLNQLYDALKALDTFMRSATTLKSAEYSKDMYETGKTMMHETNEANAISWEFLRDVDLWQLTPRRFFAQIGGYKKNSVWETQVAKSFEDGMKRASRVERAFKMLFRSFTESPELDRTVNPHKLIDIGLKTEDGQPVRITRGMMMAIYMHLLADDNRRAILYGGFNVPDMLKYYGGKVAASYGTGHTMTAGILADMTKLSRQIREVSEDNTLTEEEKQAKYEEIGKQQDELEQAGYDALDAMKNRIYNEMTDFERKLCETVTEWNDNISRGYINEVTMEMYQIKKALIKHYFPIHRDTSFVNTDFESISKNMNLTNVGWLKDRVKSAAPVLLTDLSYEMDNSMRQVSTYYGFVKAQTDFNKLYNFKQSGANKSVKDSVGDKFGKGSKTFGVSAEQYIENFIGDITGSRIKNTPSPFAAIRRNLPRATLTLNPRVALSQLASIPTAAAEVGWGAMAKGFIKGIPMALNKSAKEDLMMKDEYFYQRYWGDGGMREFADMKSGNNKIDKLWNKGARTAVGKVLLNWCQNCDVFATTTMWAMAEEWVKDNHPELSGEEYDAAVKQKYDDIITNTQPNYTKTERSDLLRDDRELMKFLTMYKTQSNQNYNILREATARLRKYASDFKNGKNGVTAEDVKQARQKCANAYTAVLIGATAVFVMLRAFANALLNHMDNYRDDDDEITAVSMLNGLTKEYVQSLSGMFVLGSEIESAAESVLTGKMYYGLSDSAVSAVGNAAENFVKLAQAYAQGKTDDIGAKWERFAKETVPAFGLPYSPVKTFIQGGKAWIKDVENGTWFEGSVERTNAVNYNRLYQALEDGDETKAEKIRSEMRRNDPDIEDSEIKSGLKKVIKGMWEDGYLNVDETVNQLVEYTGMDENDAYWKVQEWFNKTQDEDASTSHYYRLFKLMDSGSDATGAYDELLAHGTDEEQMATDIRKHIKNAFNDGDISEQQARDMLLKYGRHKANKQLVTYTKDEVDALVDSWVASQALGWDYDDKDTLYQSGDISKSELKNALVNVGGMTSEKADQRIEIMDWNKEGYAVENDKYDSIIGEYNKKLKSHGISKSIWYNYYVFESKTSGEVDANGKSIPYSKMRKLFEYIGNLNITSEQKMALARTYTDSESSIAKYKTW